MSTESTTSFSFTPGVAAPNNLPQTEFPLVRYDSGSVVCQEALIRGQYLGAHWSAMGRARNRSALWTSFDRQPGIGEARSIWPLEAARHAFMLELDGQLLADHWEWAGAAELPGDREGCRETVVRLRHTVRPVSVAIHTRLDGSPILVRWLTVQNTGGRPAAIGAADPWAGLLFSNVESFDRPCLLDPGFLLGRYRRIETCDEGEFVFEPVPLGGMVMGSRSGSSGFAPPYFMVQNRNTGETFVGALAYPGNWRLELRLDDTLRRFGDARVQHLHFRIGPDGPAPLRLLAPGESVATPEVHLGVMFGDPDACTQAWHDHLRGSVKLKQPEDLTDRVEYNHGGTTFTDQIDERSLLDEVEIAAAMGAELFVVDAGWFGPPDVRWVHGVGDWQPSPALLPHGMEGIFDHARKLGLRCGLWYEIERAGPKSRLAREHPEWLMQRNGQTIQHLDLALPEVAQFVEDLIVGEITKYRLDCFRLDENLRFGDGAQAVRDGYVESTLWRYHENLQRIFENVRRRFPGVLLQNCASGGSRNDLGMLSRFHYTQLTDNMSPAPSVKTLNGATVFLLPEQCMHHIGAYSRWGVADLDFALRAGLFEHLTISGVILSLAQSNAWALERCRYTIALYKRWMRPVISQARVFHHTPALTHLEPGDWAVLEYAAPDGSRAYAGLWRLLGDTCTCAAQRRKCRCGADEYRFVPRGLRRDRRYRVTFDNRAEALEIGGHDLVDQGLRVRVPGRLTSELLLFEAV